MKRSKTIPEAYFDDIVNEAIECMKNELSQNLKGKSLAYSFDFQEGTPNKGNSILWSEKKS